MIKNKIFIIIVISSIILVGIFLAVGLLYKEKNIFTTGLKESIQKISPNVYSYIRENILDLDSEIPAVYEKYNLPKFHLILSRKDVAHFNDLYQKFEDPRNSLNVYNLNNTWRRAKLKFNGKIYNIKIESHGRDPRGQRKNSFISYNIKLENDEQIFDAQRFNLIIREKYRSYCLPYLELGDSFGLIVAKTKLVQVKINDWEDKLYYFEHRLDDTFMESRNKSTFHRFEYDQSIKASRDKSMILTDMKHFNVEEFQKSFNKVLTERGYSETKKKALSDRYLSFNNAILKNEYKTIHRFFDIDYISSYEAVHNIEGFDGHGFMINNMYVFYDTASGKFYPAISRDQIISKLDIPQYKTPEKQLGLWNFIDPSKLVKKIIKIPLIINISRNDIIRQAKYKKIYEFIVKHGKDTVALHKKIYYDNNALTYVGNVLNISEKFNINLGNLTGKMSLQENITQLKDYLESCSTDIGIFSMKGQIQIDVLPHSMSALNIDKLFIKMPTNIKHRKGALDLIILTSINNIIDERSIKKAHFIQDAQGIHLTMGVKDILFSTTLNENLDLTDRKYTLIFNSEIFNDFDHPKDHLDIKMRNTVTNKEVILINQSELKQPVNRELYKDVLYVDDTALWAKKYSNIVSLNTALKEAIINSGKYKISEDFIIPKGYKLVINAGATLNIAENKSIVGYNGIDIRGTFEQPVTITSQYSDKPFGTVGIMGDAGTVSSINYLHISKGNESWIDGIYFSGALSIYYNGEVTISNSIISYNNADDAITLKYSPLVTINSSIFINNYADHIDFDYCSASIKNNDFIINRLENSNGDGLDMSGSNVVINNCRFRGLSDKGISVGEGSSALVYGNTFLNNSIAIAVKNGSNAYMSNNNFIGNKTDLTAYVKKGIWGGGNIYIKHEQIRPNNKCKIDKKSTLRYLPDDLDLSMILSNGQIPSIFEKLKKVGYSD
jgi:hypothetical protein